MTDKKNFYERAGIFNQAQFYGALYASGELLHPDYFHALERFHIRWARTMWVYDNVAEGSTLLDLGSGAGLLSLLKRKHVKLFGVDLSGDCARATLRNGYDFACTADLKALPFTEACFDYVVSLDVMGHIQFEEKDAVLGEVRRVLKPEGVTMHGIEIMNTDKRKDYQQMSEEELKRFVQIDGHVGMESEPDTIARFSRFFAYVQARPRFSICQSAEELVKQADEYGVPLCDADLLDYLRTLSHDERRAFNMAMGYVFQQISDLGMRLPASEYLFLKASDSSLRSLYNEHADRSALLSQGAGAGGFLDHTGVANFDGGWYPAENFPPVGRWMGRRAKLRFAAGPFAKLCLTVVTHIPDVLTNPLHVDFSLNGKSVRSLTIGHNDPQLIELSTAGGVPQTGSYELEIKADRTWQPRPDDPLHRDDREISVAVSDLRLVF
ncbi:MAG TPA: class I SAM-dependent methyltransferase [Pyrinomonadaceae bacterium]|nr:class I SAM-dependent methyltransferase [Pyrinomonadaceae bacterium]